MAEQTVELQPTESKLVSFEAIPHEAKAYQVSVNGLTGSFTATKVQVEIIGITLDKTELVGGEEFTISITFSNPHEYDVWVRPIFGFGKVVNAGFEPEAVLSGWEYYYEPHGYSGSSEWVDLGHPQHPGSNMPQFVYDPDGIPVLAAGGYCWLKLPAKGQATTSRKWMVSGGAYGLRDVCVKVDDAFYLVYDPGWATRTVGGITVTVNYRSVSIEPFSGVVPDIVTIGLPPEAVTIDAFEIQLDYATNRVNTRLTITNNTGKTLISRPSDWIYTKLSVRGYSTELVPLYGTAELVNKVLLILFSTTAAGAGSSIGDIPPGTTVKEFSYKPSFSVRKPNLAANIPDGTVGYAHIHFYQRDERPLEYIYGADVEQAFKGVFRSSWQTFERISPPIKVIGGYYPYTHVRAEGYRFEE